jgi:hypothetical protein
MVRQYFATAREKHKVKVLGNKMIRKKFGLRKADISEQFRVLHVEEIREL